MCETLEHCSSLIAGRFILFSIRLNASALVPLQNRLSSFSCYLLTSNNDINKNNINSVQGMKYFHLHIRSEESDVLPTISKICA